MRDVEKGRMHVAPRRAVPKGNMVRLRWMALCMV